MNIGTRKLGKHRWEAFYREEGVHPDDWMSAEGKSEDEAILNLSLL